jgi:hypothetical protein
MESLPEPGFVVLAGDWHGNLLWFMNYIVPEAVRAFDQAGESRRIIIQLGDFGFSPAAYGPDLPLMQSVLAENDMELWWLDGNHEQWPAIRELVRTGERSQFPPEAVNLPVYPRIRYLPRGTRWTWHGKRWLVVGGAVSVDRLLRQEGVSWFRDEEITDAEADRIISDGRADVLLSHDVPFCWFPPHLPAPAAAWEPVLPLAREHSRRLERIALSCEVERVFHGHYHIWRQDWYKEPYRGGCNIRVTGFAPDGYDLNMILVDVRNP